MMSTAVVAFEWIYSVGYVDDSSDVRFEYCHPIVWQIRLDFD